MSSQAKINVYMERHRIGPLFEDLMNKVLRDMPEEPMIYLLRTMYKKAGMEIPQGIRYGGLRKSTVELTRGNSPERPARSAQDSEEQFTSPPYRGPGGHHKVNRTRMTEEELLAAESLSSSRRTQNPKASSVGPELSGTASVNPDPFSSWQEQNEFEAEEEEEEFESVSQVTGPRQPVWKLPGAEANTNPGTSIPLRPAFSDDTPSQHSKRFADKSLYATTPGPSSDRAVKNAEDLSATAKTWSEGANRVSFDESPDDPPTSRSLQSGASSGGWHIPDDTDLASGYDWNQPHRRPIPIPSIQKLSSIFYLFTAIFTFLFPICTALSQGRKTEWVYEDLCLTQSVCHTQLSGPHAEGS
ncbi:Golgi snap receptor complex member 2 [Plakobranchus ocellatus]|uniref:Golgi snap receptor complex member 2 n=1 Tax=Plakobranchus ocellatus TaxID=259542 RepID=A0AAV3ZZ59_9GAST|nr:Golgi snap receptor complex member 2 [Plakobranchus ocellatus]